MILLYHKIYPEAKTTWWVTPDAFYLQMHDLAGKKVVYLDDYDPSDPNQCVITFDGVYENVWKYAVPILQHFGYPFELFVVGGSVGQGNEFDTVEPYAKFADRETLRKMVNAGGRLQWHTWSHPVLLAPQPEENYRHELTVPDDLRQLCPEGFRWFAYPHGKRDEELRRQTQKYFHGGIACDDGESGNLLDLPRLTVVEKTRLRRSTVSLIIPCYNYGRFAGEAIESALYQIYPPDEILFIDDASTDDSVEIAKRYEPRIRVEVNPHNLGVIANFNKAVSLTKGDYICLLGADNRFRSDYVERTKATLDSDPKAAMAYTHFVLFGQKAAIEATRANAGPHPTIPGMFLRRFPAKPARPIEEENYIHGSSMYRREAYDQVGGYVGGSGRPEDHFLFARMLSAGWRAKLVDDFLLEYRQHSTDQINQLKGLELTNAQLRAISFSQQHTVQALTLQVQALTSQGERLSSEVHARDLELSAIKTSRAWRMVMRLRSLRDRIAPPNGTRSRVLRQSLQLLFWPLRIVRRQGRTKSDLKVIRSSSLFDASWYLAHNPDVAAASMDPAVHYLRHGAQEGRDPSPKFSSRRYLETYPDVRQAAMNPLVHYLRYGQKEGREAFSSRPKNGTDEA